VQKVLGSMSDSFEKKPSVSDSDDDVPIFVKKPPALDPDDDEPIFSPADFTALALAQAVNINASFRCIY